MPRHAGLAEYLLHDFPEEKHEIPQVKYATLSFSKNLTGQAIRLRRRKEMFLF
jgi:hypothetical protein